ncbi:hypothetical protein AB4084_00040 [Lysobacter sp. 2RAB21]
MDVLDREFGFEAFKAMMRSGRRPDGSAIDPAMPFATMAALDDTDRRALHLYLRQLPAKAAPLYFGGAEHPETSNVLARKALDSRLRGNDEQRPKPKPKPKPKRRRNDEQRQATDQKHPPKTPAQTKAPLPRGLRLNPNQPNLKPPAQSATDYRIP